MKTKLGSRISYANVVATLALFAALGGTSYAAVKISGKSIKTRTIAANKLKKHTLTATEIKSGSRLAQDFKAGQLLSGPRGATGPQGAKATRARKERRATLEAGVAGREWLRAALLGCHHSPNGQVYEGQAVCPHGKVVLGGGAEAGEPPPPGVSISGSGSESSGTFWFADVYNNSGADVVFRSQAICGVVR